MVPARVGARTPLARDAAIAVLREWLEATPDEPIARHMLAALGADAAPERASDDYVRSTFDSFAEVFDRTLARLDYRAPQLVVDAIAGHAGAPRGTLDVLDAGCGTGLCGPLLRPYARALVGVDLSARMLDQARLRGSYDELVEAELTACLRDRRDAFDLVACADTLCYFGALDDVLAAAAATLRPGGLLAFTVERLDAPADAGSAADHRLLAHGRYAHARSYVERALGAAGLLVKHIDDCHLRNESGTPVAGLVVVALRPALRPETRRSAS